MDLTFIVLATLLPIQSIISESVDKRFRGEGEMSLDLFQRYPQEASAGKFTFNPKFWGKDVDFSCVSPWNSAGGPLRGGTLISKRHIVFANHFPLWAGVRILFVGQDGGVCPCYIDKVQKVPRSDIAIGLLNAEVTPNIHPAKILPENYARFIGEGDKMPVVTLNQRRQASLTELDPIQTNGFVRSLGSHIAKSQRWGRHRVKIITGDSGSPAFLLAGRDLILLYCLTVGGTGGGHGLHLRRKDVQAVMDELCPGYKLEAFDFSQVKSGR